MSYSLGIIHTFYIESYKTLLLSGNRLTNNKFTISDVFNAIINIPYIRIYINVWPPYTNILQNRIYIKVKLVWLLTIPRRWNIENISKKCCKSFALWKMLSNLSPLILFISLLCWAQSIVVCLKNIKENKLSSRTAIYFDEWSEGNHFEDRWSKRTALILRKKYMISMLHICGGT